ncbi:hypothetical protein [Micrococcus luteus]|uniref:hypothetical protein n=1 Tax=Micrococcus luteus TaxID=1270 RepID=UPI00147D21B9|nr:hypothetical protein [Micrococcus luteus]NNM38134.1 hypothetical protein [Micrococcus luteus]
MNTTIYRRPIVTALNHAQHVRAAYQAAGLDAPQHGAELRRVLNETPTPDAEAARLLAAGYEAEDVDAWHADALDAMTRALAGERLRAALSKMAPQIDAAHRDEWTDQAAHDLAPAFQRLAKNLGTAAQKLPTGPDPLDLAAVVEADAGAAYTTARESLAALSAYAGIHTGTHMNGRPARWAELLGIVHVPETVTEQRTRLTGEARNADKLDSTHAVRDIITLIEKGQTDRAILDIARGKHKGFTLQLATTAELREREARVHRAMNYTVVDDA